jgi:hypothetical protein
VGILLLADPHLEGRLRPKIPVAELRQIGKVNKLNLKEKGKYMGICYGQLT